MFHDIMDYTDDMPIDCDLCIAGGGASGIAIAQRFIGTNKKIVVLESGGFDYEEDVQRLAEGFSIGQPYFSLDGCRLRMLGGSTNHWQGDCSPLDPIDFQRREWVPHSGWPISYQSMQPWYKEARKLMRLGSFDYDVEAKAKEGYPYLDFESSLIEHKVWRHSDPALRFGHAFYHALRLAPNVHVLLHTNLVKIGTDGTGQTVKEFKVASLGGHTKVVRARSFVLALGGLENPRLLLNATEPDQAGLGNRNDLVGRFFMEHLNIIGGEIITLDHVWPTAYQPTDTGGSPLTVLIRNSPEQQEKKQTLNSAVGFAKSMTSRQKSAGYSSLHSIKKDLKNIQVPDRLGHHLWNVITDLSGIRSAMFERVGTSLWASLEGEQSPNPESRVLLSDERDSLGLRKIILDWRLTELDWHSAHSLIRVVGEELGRLHKGRLRMSSVLLKEHIGWSETDVQGGYHHMGTTRMSDDPKHGVVDANCKVFGTDNLFIAGSSVFPTGGCANPTFTIVALALRLAERLDEHLQGQRL